MKSCRFAILCIRTPGTSAGPPLHSNNAHTTNTDSTHEHGRAAFPRDREFRERRSHSNHHRTREGAVSVKVDLTYAELVESVATLAAEKLAPVMRSHPRTKPLLPRPLNMADSSFVMHCRSYSSTGRRPAHSMKTRKRAVYMGFRDSASPKLPKHTTETLDA